MDYLDKTFHHLKKFEVFEGFSEKELALLLSLMKVEVFEKGSYIIKEKEPGEDLYIIKSGTVEISKKVDKINKDFKLAVLSEGECFGEMAFLESSTRSASAKALEHTEVLVLSLSELKSLSEKNDSYSKIFINLAKKISGRLRESNEIAVRSLKAELSLVQAHDHMGQFIIHLFILLSIFFYSLKLEEIVPKTMGAIIPSLLIICFGLSAFLVVKQSGYPLEFHGLTLKHWKRNTVEAIFLSIPILVGMILLKWILIETVPGYEDLVLFGDYNRQPYFFLFQIGYVLLVPLQEFIARGCLQSCLQNFFRSKDRVFLGILTSNLLFGMFHGLHAFSFIIIAFLLGCFWGWIYSRQESLVGPCVSHALIGLWGFFFLNYQTILG